MDETAQSACIPLNTPEDSEQTKLQNKQAEDDPVPVTLALRLKPFCDKSDGKNNTNLNRCFFPETSSNLPNDGQIDGNCMNYISYRPRNSTAGHAGDSREEILPIAAGLQGPNTWKFENGTVFSEISSQEHMFLSSLEQFIEVVLDGYDLTIIAYGPSGSGKSYTLFGPDNALGLPNSENEFGLLQRFVRSLFHRAEKIEESRKPNIIFSVSSIDVDDNDVRDLLADTHGKIDLVDCANPCGGTKVEMVGVTEIECGSIDEVLCSFENGRVIQNPSSNTTSIENPKSHNIFSINVIQTFQAIGPFVEKIVKQSTVRFVEIASPTTASTDTLRGTRHPSFRPEFLGSGHNVKLGNLALGNVVSALGDPRRNVSYEVRQELYQYSLITRILQDALGGGSLTLAICCIYSTECEVEESINTLNFAKQLSNINCHPILRSNKVDADNADAEIAFIHENGANIESNGCHQTNEDLLQKDLRSVSANINVGHMPNLRYCSDPPHLGSSIPTKSLAESTLPFIETSTQNVNDELNNSCHNHSVNFPLHPVSVIDGDERSIYSANNILNAPHVITNPSMVLQEVARKSYKESLNRKMTELQGLQEQHHQLIFLKQQYLSTLNNFPGHTHAAINSVGQHDMSIIDSQTKLLAAQITIIQSKIQQLQLLFQQTEMKSPSSTFTQANDLTYKKSEILVPPEAVNANLTNPLLSPLSPNNNYTHSAQPISPYSQVHLYKRQFQEEPKHLKNPYTHSNTPSHADGYNLQHMVNNQRYTYDIASNGNIRGVDFQTMEPSQRLSPFLPITQRSTPQDVSPLSHKQSPVSVQMYLQSNMCQNQHEQSHKQISPGHPGFALPNGSPTKHNLSNDVILPLNLSGMSNPKNSQHDETSYQNLKLRRNEELCGPNDDTTTNYFNDNLNGNKKIEPKKDGAALMNPGTNKNLAEQIKLASIVEESEHELTPPKLSQTTDRSPDLTDSFNKTNYHRFQKCIDSSQSDISRRSSSVATEDEIRVVTGCSSSEEDVLSSSPSSDNDDNDSFDSECSDMSSNTPDPDQEKNIESEDPIVKQRITPAKIQDLYEQFRSENFMLLARSEALLQQMLSPPEDKEVSKNLNTICQKLANLVDSEQDNNNLESARKLIPPAIYDPEKISIPSPQVIALETRHNSTTNKDGLKNSDEAVPISDSKHVDIELQYTADDLMPCSNPLSDMTGDAKGIPNDIHQQIKDLVLRRDAEKASVVQLSSDLKIVDTQLRELREGIKIKGGLIRDLEKTDREIKVAIGQYQKRRQQLQEEQAETRRKLRKANDYLRDAEQRSRLSRVSSFGNNKKRHVDDVGDTSALKGHITEYRSQIEDMQKKINQLDESQKCLGTIALEGAMPKEHSHDLVEQLCSVPTARLERVREEQTMMSKMKDDYARLKNKLKKENERKAQLKRNAEGDEIKIRRLEKQLCEKEQLVLQLSKSLQVSQDLEEFKQSLDSKEQILDKAMIDLQKEKLEFEHEKLLQKQTNMQGTQGHHSDNCNMPDPKKDTCSIGSIPNHPLNENKTKHQTYTSDEKKTRSEIKDLREQKENLYELLQAYEFRKHEYKNRRQDASATLNDENDAVKENREFLENYKHLVTQSTVTIELMDMAIDYKNEKLCGKAVAYDKKIATDSLALKKLCSLDLGETRNLIHQMFNYQVGLRIHLENIKKERDSFQQIYEEIYKQNQELHYKYRAEKRTFNKHYDIQKRDFEQRIQLLLKSQTNSGVSGGAGINNDLQAACERKIQELKEKLRQMNQDGQQYKRFFKEHQSCIGLKYEDGGVNKDYDDHAYLISKRTSKRSRRGNNRRRRKSSDGGSIPRTNSGEDGPGSAGSDISALDPTLVERFQRHARQMRMEENSAPNNSVTIKQRKHGKNRLVIKSKDVD